MSRTTGRIATWLKRVLDMMDERYICGCCDDRFPDRGAGISHVIACHPEYAATFANEPLDHQWTPATEPLPARPGVTSLPFVPVWS